MSNQPFTREKFDMEIVLRALKDSSFQARLLSNPKEVYKQELGHEIPDEVEIRVVKESPNVFYVVIPHSPGELADDQLRMIAQRRLTHREPCWGLGDGLD